ncbi:hypothetical protein IFM89_017009 [Coptis chinensis]|uniref:DCD domain-containing protein n=1 Tax=Coptis chinensis TaxID=261450 RepID=A0A835LRT0_9MAGN|nr:hypothetical protein IFM89_017009 [Coptis chinensis]
MENFNNNQQSFWQFSDQLRVQNTNFGNLSINDGIWGSSLTSKKNEERRNFDVRVGGERVSGGTQNLQPSKGTNFNGFNDGWKNESYNSSGNGNGVFHKGVYSKYGNNNNNINKKNKKEVEVEKKSNSNSNNNNSSNNNKVVDKRFKTLPATEALPRNEVVGGYIFVCNNDTMEENLKRQLFDGQNFVFQAHKLSLFDVHLAASFGGTNIDPSAWGDKKCPGESRFPAQVRVATRKVCEPLEEDSFRPILHHYDGPKFRLELNVPEALALLDIFADTNP